MSSINPASSSSASSFHPTARFKGPASYESLKEACRMGDKKGVLELLHNVQVIRALDKDRNNYNALMKIAEQSGSKESKEIVAILRAAEEVNERPWQEKGGLFLLHATIEEACLDKDKDKRRAAYEEALRMIRTPGANLNDSNERGSPFALICARVNNDGFDNEIGLKLFQEIINSPLLDTSENGPVESAYARIAEYLPNLSPIFSYEFIKILSKDPEKHFYLLKQACDCNDLKGLEYLIVNLGVDINIAVGRFGESALMITKSPQIAAWLLDHGANPNFQSKDGYTVLMRACSSNLPEIVELLLKNPETVKSILLKNKEGKTAIQIALEKGYTEIAKMLEKAIQQRTDDVKKEVFAATPLPIEVSNIVAKLESSLSEEEQAALEKAKEAAKKTDSEKKEK